MQYCIIDIMGYVIIITAILAVLFSSIIYWFSKQAAKKKKSQQTLTEISSADQPKTKTKVDTPDNLHFFEEKTIL